MADDRVRRKFSDALDALIEQVQQDRSILAAVLGGSLSHDTVWEKSDIDLLLVTVDDRKIESGHRALYADGVNVHAILLPRAEFRKLVEGAIRQSFMHSFLTKGRLLYTHDDTIADLFASLEETRRGKIGGRDTELQMLEAATSALGAIDKAHKWLVTRGDLEYTSLWILYAATGLAQIEVLEARKLVDREVLPQAMAINPAFFKTIYVDVLNTRKTEKTVEAALEAVDRYVAERAPRIFAAVLEHLKEVGDTRSATDIDDYFLRTFGINHVSLACEYLADQGLIGKGAVTIQLTKRSNVGVQELAFFHQVTRPRRHAR